MNRFLVNTNRKSRTPIVITEMWLGSTVVAELVYVNARYVFGLFLIVIAMAILGAALYFISEVRNGAVIAVTLAKMVVYTVLALAALPFVFWLLFNVIKI